MTWKYTIKYSTQQCAPAFSALQVTTISPFCTLYWATESIFNILVDALNLLDVISVDVDFCLGFNIFMF